MLKAYAAYDEEVNYCQGMNFLAGLLLTYLPTQSAAFGVLVILMQERGLRELYKTDLSVLQVCASVRAFVLRLRGRGGALQGRFIQFGEAGLGCAQCMCCVHVCLADWKGGRPMVACRRSRVIRGEVGGCV